MIKKQGYWPAQVPGNNIDAHMMTKRLGEMATFIQDLQGMPYYVHCTCNVDYVTKIMSLHGMLEEKNNHSTWWCMNGEWKTMFNYAKPFSRHNKRKHWIKDVNNHCHDLIGLETTWKTKWWPN